MSNGAPDEMRDPGTPEEVQIRLEPREPAWDPALGTEVSVEAEGTPRHRLVTIGDSLTHGFQSGAIFNTSISYPAIIAHELGWYGNFRHPRYQGFGGLPLNLELLIRQLEQEFGETINLWEQPLAMFRTHRFMDEVEQWWERGGGSEPPNVLGIQHNLAVFGWDLRDALETTADICRRRIGEPSDQLLSQIVENATERAALRVLNSARDGSGHALTPFEAAKALGEEGVEGAPADAADRGDGIETLIVFLGANNALGAVTQLRVAWSGPGFDDLEAKRRFTVWRPSHFASEFDQVVEAVRQIRVRHVIWATVPHVTIAPVARGIGPKLRPGSRYFPYYTRPWVTDEDFNERDDPFITGAQARAIDSAIDQYNDHITRRVKEARESGRTGTSWTSRAFSIASPRAGISPTRWPGPPGGGLTSFHPSCWHSRRCPTPASSPPPPGAHERRPVLARRGPSHDHRLRDRGSGALQRDGASRSAVPPARRPDPPAGPREGGLPALDPPGHPDIEPSGLPVLRSPTDRLARPAAGLHPAHAAIRLARGGAD
jgi:hypothetical protein